MSTLFNNLLRVKASSRVIIIREVDSWTYIITVFGLIIKLYFLPSLNNREAKSWNSFHTNRKYIKLLYIVERELITDN